MQQGHELIDRLARIRRIEEPVELRNRRPRGVGQVRIIDRPYGKIHEQLTSLDEDARSLTYIVPTGNPVPVTAYQARMTVIDGGGKGRLTWSCVFEPDGVSEEEAARGIRQRYSAVIKVIEAYRTRR